MARVAIAGFMHEPNCVVPGVSDYGNFARPTDRPGILQGDEVMAEFAKQGEMPGMLIRSLVSIKTTY